MEMNMKGVEQGTHDVLGDISAFVSRERKEKPYKLVIKAVLRAGI
jgi:hypothetical protein